MTTEPPVDNALLYPDPTPDPDVKPKIEPTDHSPSRNLEPQTAADPRSLQTPEASVPPRGQRDPGEGPPTLNWRPPTPIPTPITQLIDCVSALCVDWNAISPAIAHSTCVTDASQLSLGIHLRTALTNEGLAELRIKSLVRVQTLCRMITIIMMNLTKISEESAEESIHNSSGDADFLFVGADPQKVQQFNVGLSVYSRMDVGWQLMQEVPSTPMLRSVDEMPDTSYDYDTELYSDGES
ncbi:hypothetical protein Moror_13799 [Moniliophthora roreri MCA 2997]|uniref:Uncharacterized protein n=2 Tax=Moniliophthora roreri TaxID=221103 RepID=V2X7N7_MONRO|nr:hypothetical protein Moror_13799 [Moniliophthora roreri MCA 2997]